MELSLRSTHHLNIANFIVESYLSCVFQKLVKQLELKETTIALYTAVTEIFGSITMKVRSLKIL